MNKLMTMILFVVGMMLAQSSFAVAPTIKILPQDVTVNVDQTYTFSVTADNFSHYEIQFTTLFNSNLLEFVSYSDINPLLQDFNLNYNPPGSGYPEGLLASWLDPNLQVVTLPAGTVLFKFTVKGKAPGTSQVTVPCGGDYVCEAIDKNDNTFNNFPSVPANVTVAGTQVFDGFTLSISCETGPTGSEVCVNVVAEKDFTNIAALQMDIAFDNTKLAFTTFKNCNATLGIDCASGNNYFVTGGRIYVTWNASASQLPAGVTLPDGSVLFQMCFTVLAPTGTTIPIAFSDEPFTKNEFYDNNDQQLTNVTLINGCINAGTGVVNEKITLTASQESATTGSLSCVKITAVHFDSLALLQFGISWDNSVVTFNKIQNCNALLGLANCGSAPTFQPQPNGKEIRFKWTDPNPASGKGVTIPDNATLFEVCYNVIGAAGKSTDITLGTIAGDTAKAVDVKGKVFDMVFKKGKITVPTASTVTLAVTDKDVCPGTTVCIPITTTNFTNINSMEFAVHWDSTKLKLVGIQNCNAALNFNCSFTGGNFFKLFDDLIVSWFSQSGGCVTLPAGATLFEMCFQVIGTNGMSSPLNIIENPNTMALEIIDCDGNVLDVNTINQNIAITNAVCCNLVVNKTVANTTCKGSSDGSIFLNVTGGVGPYSYMWDNTPLNTNNNSSLLAGFYNVTVKDTGNPGCSTTVTQIQVKDGDDLNLTSTITPAECNCTGGSILINVTGGTPILYNWTPSASQNPNTNLSCGTYSVVVTSQSGCQKTLTNLVITAKPSNLNIFADVFNPKCHGSCDGLISASVTPLDPSAVYVWNTTPPQNTQTASNLCAGVYIVSVTDADGCSKSASFELSDPDSLLLVTSSDSASAPSSKNGKAIVTASGGTNIFTYKWNTTPPQTTATATGLGKGNYTVTVTDSNGCTKIATVTVSAKDTIIIPPPPVTDTVVLVNLLASTYHSFGVSCQGECDGTIKAIAPDSAVQPLSYAWSGSASGQKGEIAIQLCAGAYNVVITDANGVKYKKKYALTLSPPPALNLQVVVGTNPTPTATAIVDGGVPPYSYKINNDPYSSVNVFNIDGYSPVTILVTDANGCQAIETVNGPLTRNCDDARLVITPNGDDLNEYFVLGCANNFPCNKLMIFDRFGRILYQKSGYLNDWNGKDDQGNPLPEGGYFWAFEYYTQTPCPNLATVKPYVAKGSITIVR